MIKAALLAATLAAAAHAETFTVYTFDYEYSQNSNGVGPLPDDPTIHVGDTVHWVLTEGFHTISACAGTDETYDSGFLMSGQAFDHTFTHAGRFEYYCAFHGNDNFDGTAGGMAGIVTVIDDPLLPCPADIGTTGGSPGHDHVLDNNDFVAFIDFFFNHDAAADVGATGGIEGTDGHWDNNDFVVYINLFFQGCP